MTLTNWPDRLALGLWLAAAGLAILILWWFASAVLRQLRNPIRSPRGEQDDEIAFDLLDSLKTPAVRPRQPVTTMTVDTAARVTAIRPAGPSSMPIPAHEDDPFFETLMAGITALLNANFWMASQLLNSIVDTVIVPYTQAAQAAGITPVTGAHFTAPWSPQEREAFANELATHSSPLLSPENVIAAVDYLASQYQLAADTYIQMRARASGQPSSIGVPEQRYKDWLQSHQPRLTLPTQQVITWQRISLVLPAYNEQEVIAETVANCIAAVYAYCPNAEIIVVDDGSRDCTGAIVDSIARQNAGVVALHNRPNRGYGGALRTGFDAARGDLIFFMDSDGQFDINEIRQLLIEERRVPGAAVIGFRAKRNDPLMRKLNAAGWKRAARVVVGLKGIRDIDCAFKLLPARELRQCAIQAEGASINVEFLTKMQRQGVPLIQLPVSHHPRTKGSPTGANWRVIARAFKELFRLRRHLSTWKPASVENGVQREVAAPALSAARSR